jgi:flotillin
MGIIQQFLSGLNIAVIIGSIAGLLFLLLVFARALWHVCGPNELLVFSGRKHRWPDGSYRGYKVVQGGGFRNPIWDKVERVSLGILEVPISIRGAFSKGGIALNVDAIANVKISSNERVIGNALERFLNTDPNGIRRVAKETLEGHLRGVLARLTPEEVNEDRLRFAEELALESEHDLNKLGIHLDVFKIQHVSDDRHYLDSLGRAAIAAVIREAEMAESDNERDAELAEADNQSRSSVAQSTSEANVAKMRNDLRRIKAELEASVKVEEERTLAAAREARAKAEQELQGVRGQLEGLRLRADQVLPAEAQLVAQEFAARGQAAILRERGVAMSEALTDLSRAWQEAGDSAMSIFVIEDIEKILAAGSRGVTKVKVKELQMIDGGNGQVLSNYITAYPAMLQSVLGAVSQATGIDVAKAMSGKSSSSETPPATVRENGEDSK